MIESRQEVGGLMGVIVEARGGGAADAEVQECIVALQEGDDEQGNALHHLRRVVEYIRETSARSRR